MEPHFNNTQKTVEPHLLQVAEDFYGCRLRLILCAYLRPEAHFTTMEALIDMIRNDTVVSAKLLDEEPSLGLRNHSFFDGGSAAGVGTGETS